jgi:pyrroloquinoline quinone (PQQ) biosynthesis protein C
MTFFERLHAETETPRRELLRVQIIQDALAGRIRLPQYIAFLTQAYHHVKHTVPLLMACGGRLPQRLSWLRAAIAEYIQEEIGHEEWILSDIAACGADAERVRGGRPNFATEQMLAYAYHLIDRGNPVAFFGMVHVLEGTSIAIATNAAAAIRAALGLPPAALTYLSSHGRLDIEHVQVFEGLMNRLDDPQDQAAVIDCAQSIYRLYGDIFRSLPSFEANALQEAA